MLNKVFGSLDFGKLTANSISGFFSGAAILLLVDAFTPGHLAANLLNEKPAGIIVVELVFVVVGSYAFGLLVDNVFHTFGRWFASKFWKPLQIQFDYRNCLMENLGLSKAEFEWVQSKDSNAANEVETHYMRYTEVAGSSAYAIMLLAIAIAPFLSFEFHQPIWKALVVTGIVDIVAFVLLVTSAASLAKYEMNKTASAMDEIRSMSSHNISFSSIVQEGGMGTGPLKLFGNKRWLLSLFLAVILAPVILINPFSAKYLRPISNTLVISALNSDNSVPTLELKVTAKKPAPDAVVSSMIVQLAETVHTLKPVGGVSSANIDLIDQTPMPNKPPWHLNASLGQVIGANNTIQLSAEFSSTQSVYAGNWQFPVMVVDGDNNTYLLAYVKVTILPIIPQE